MRFNTEANLELHLDVRLHVSSQRFSNGIILVIDSDNPHKDHLDVHSVT